MPSPLSDSEQIVIKELYKDPTISLKDITKTLNTTREEWAAAKKDGRFASGTVDVRSVSKFKSIALKKIHKELISLAESKGLDYSKQWDSTPEKEIEEVMTNTLNKEGIFIGYDYRMDTKVYLFYTSKGLPKDLPGIRELPAHVCNEKCEKECSSLVNLLLDERGISSLDTSLSTGEKLDRITRILLDRNPDWISFLKKHPEWKEEIRKVMKL